MTKKKLLGLVMTATSTVILAFTFHNQQTVNSLETATNPVAEQSDKAETVPKNMTIRVMGERLAHMTEEEVNSYLDLPDDLVILATESSGGFTYSLDGSLDGAVETFDQDGNLIESVRFTDENAAATIGEVKEHLKNLREAN